MFIPITGLHGFVLFLSLVDRLKMQCTKSVMMLPITNTPFFCTIRFNFVKKNGIKSFFLLKKPYLYAVISFAKGKQQNNNISKLKNHVSFKKN